MPIFEDIDGCDWVKFGIWAAILIVIISAVALIGYATLGFGVSIATIALAAILLKYAMDQWGDLFLARERITKEKMEELRAKQIRYPQ